MNLKELKEINNKMNELKETVNKINDAAKETAGIKENNSIKEADKDLTEFDIKISLVQAWAVMLMDSEYQDDYKDFVNKLMEANNPEYGPTFIYFDYKTLDLFVEAHTQGTIIPNAIIVGCVSQSINLEEMSKNEDEFKEFMDNFLLDAANFHNWVLYGPNGEKKLL